MSADAGGPLPEYRRIAVFGGVYNNWRALDALLEDARRLGVEAVFCLGDMGGFGPNPDRGIYKSTDGGRSWSKIKYVDENTGFTDLAMDPSNPDVLYAASYLRRRTGCWCSTMA